MHLVVYGPEGSGKGTQAHLLSEKLKLPLITTGDLVREAAKDDKNYLSEIAKQALTNGKYLTDKDICLLLSEKLEKPGIMKGFILDGFPRTISQALFLGKVLSKKGGLDRFIYLRLSDKQAIERLKKRKRIAFEGSNVLHDDPQKVRRRLESFRKMEKEILDFYEKQNLVLEIDASLSIEEIFNNIIKGLRL